MAREIKEDVIAEISRKEDDRGGIMSIRVVSWNKGTPKLEKRSFWTTMEGEVRTGKIVGLTSEDFDTILEKKDQILEAFSISESGS